MTLRDLGSSVPKELTYKGEKQACRKCHNTKFRSTDGRWPFFCNNCGEQWRQPKPTQTYSTPTKEKPVVPLPIEKLQDPDGFLTPGEVAALFRVDPKTVTRWAASGRIGSIKTPGGHRRFRALEVRALLEGGMDSNEDATSNERQPGTTPTPVEDSLFADRDPGEGYNQGVD
jgi:excisionase family DNA binding protein